MKRVIFKAGWHSKVYSGPSRGRWWIWVGPYVLGDVRAWDAS